MEKQPVKSDQYHQKKQLEQLLADYFMQVCSGLPEGKLQSNESPDFIFSLNNSEKIGIEMTRLYPKSHEFVSSDENGKYKTEEELVSKAMDFYESKSELKCFVKILFSESIHISPERILSLSVLLAGKIAAKTNDFKLQQFNQALIRRNLPEGIETILILSNPGFDYNLWERSNNLGIPENLPDDIRYSIHKKDEKLKLYLRQNLDEYWLLITTDKLRQQKPVNIGNLLAKNAFTSDFKKVFILELIPGKVTSLFQNL